MTSTKSPNPIDKYVGGRIRTRRIMLGMSQEKLGEALGLTFQQVQKYEKGTNRVGASRLSHIADALQVPPSYFFEGGPSGHSFTLSADAHAINDFITTSEGIAVARAFAQLSPALRRSIVALIETLTEGTDAIAAHSAQQETSPHVHN